MQPRGTYILQESHQPVITTAVFKISKESKQKTKKTLFFN